MRLPDALQTGHYRRPLCQYRNLEAGLALEEDKKVPLTISI